jgi:hypothetical protein
MVGDFNGDKPQTAAVFTDNNSILRAAVTVNWPKALLMCRRMIGSHTVSAAVEELERLPRLGATTSTGK